MEELFVLSFGAFLPSSPLNDENILARGLENAANLVFPFSAQQWEYFLVFNKSSPSPHGEQTVTFGNDDAELLCLLCAWLNEVSCERTVVELNSRSLIALFVSL
jgi:hypothetical protein